MSTVKQKILELLQHLPDDCTVEDVQYQLYVSEKIRRGLESITREGGIAHNQAKQRLSKWLTE